LTDRNPRGAWEKEGSRDIVERARERARQILAEHHPRHLGEDVEKELAKIVKHICEREGVDTIVIQE